MKKELKITLNEPCIQKYDIVMFCFDQRYIVMEVEANEITVHPYPEGSWFVTAFRFVWIEIKYGIKKFWRWIKTPA